MMKTLLVQGAKTFKITVPDDAKITFGPWSPPSMKRAGGWTPEERAGTLRIYQGSKENIIACFSGVVSFRSMEMDYMEEVAREEGATIWKSDEHGYTREDKTNVKRGFVTPEVRELEESHSDDETVF